ncbi:tRNA1(Val) (adenine(37)-N6)-methyltransferase [Pseudothermotoga elfii]|uniref:tRNA1(Val) (adenine(37)-N6)-methyltransferase n=1 Tax=Pseudothermotoga elfii TaxID=38322 RepID=UPI000427AD21|nr:methyltransferase [Pseudothermotoga elfii]
MENLNFENRFDPDILNSIFTPNSSDFYRITHATTLLAWYSKPKKDQRKVIELGCATGVVCAYIASKYNRYVVGIDKDHDLIHLAQRTVQMNNLYGKVDLVNISCKDVSKFFAAESFDMVISNPPHHITGVPSPNEKRRQTRTTDFETVREFVEAAAYLLKNRGEFVFVLSPTHLIFWINEFLRKKMQPKKILPVYGSSRRDAVLILMRGTKNGGIGFSLEPPIILKRV